MPGKLILQIETATTCCSVALAENGIILGCKEQNERNIHASSITLFIEEVMLHAGKKYKDLDAVAISMGPGSYTGLRIGVSTAKGLCYALDIPLIAVSTLEAMASYLIDKGDLGKNILLCPMIDARRMEVFTALYDTQLNIIESVNAKILDENSYNNYFVNHKVIFFGDGSDKCKQLFSNNPSAEFIHMENSAVNLTRLALNRFNANETENVAYFEPYYLKEYLIKPPAVK
ncbi:MAG: tsaB [Sphingobacteriales bacterium]|nr:tsaB [Sphingobacteriales bacterium]